jgi:hypothetical protein
MMSDMLLSAPVDREGHYTALSVNAGLIRVGFPESKRAASRPPFDSQR